MTIKQKLWLAFFVGIQLGVILWVLNSGDSSPFAPTR